jgi:molybdopterin converting factor small subunit
MSITIEIPTAFRRFTNGAPKIDCGAATVADALNVLTSRFPDLGRHVRDDQGQIRQFLNVYLNEEDIRFLGGESCSLKEGDRVLLVPSIAGGLPCQSESYVWIVPRPRFGSEPCSPAPLDRRRFAT